jgi:hypothetical protein
MNFTLTGSVSPLSALAFDSPEVASRFKLDLMLQRSAGEIGDDYVVACFSAAPMLRSA